MIQSSCLVLVKLSYVWIVCEDNNGSCPATVFSILDCFVGIWGIHKNNCLCLDLELVREVSSLVQGLYRRLAFILTLYSDICYIHARLWASWQYLFKHLLFNNFISHGLSLSLSAAWNTKHKFNPAWQQFINHTFAICDSLFRLPASAAAVD